MKIVMITVASVNGKTTRGDEANIYAWTSKEDQDLFFSLRDKYTLIVMGRKTYEAAREKMEFTAGKRRIVMTRSPEKYKKQEIPGQLEFTGESPAQLVKRLEREGYKELLLVGGVEVDAAFLRAGLVSELHLTIEPFLFGKEKNLLADFPFDIPLRLEGLKQLNRRGTLHLTYKIIRN